MASPFPGMDPFIESQEWTDFHTRFITVIGETLTPRVRNRYVVRVERRVYVEHQWGEVAPVVPDLVLLEGQPPAQRPGGPAAEGVKAAPARSECILPMPVERREALLVIRARETREVVTVMELLSPTNKARGADGFREYQKKRESVLQSLAHLVELDLLRGGQRLPTLGGLPEGDYYALVCRRERRPRAEVYAWTLRDRLPAIPVPLSAGDPDVDVDLQQVFTTTYDRAAYEDSVAYEAELRPPLRADDAAWVRELLAAR